MLIMQLLLIINPICTCLNQRCCSNKKKIEGIAAWLSAGVEEATESWGGLLRT